MDNKEYFPAKFWPKSGTPSQNGLSFCYRQDRLDLINIFIDPYLGDQNAAFCPGDRDETTTRPLGDQIEEYGWAKIAYCIYPGYLVDPAGYEWGDSTRRGQLMPLKITKVPGLTPTVGCELRDWENFPGEYWGLKHPYNKYNVPNDKMPKGQPNAFADGSASFVRFEDPDSIHYKSENLLPFATDKSYGYRFWWPGYTGWLEK
jgi:hypothetical protein